MRLPPEDDERAFSTSNNYPKGTLKGAADLCAEALTMRDNVFGISSAASFFPPQLPSAFRIR